VISDRDSGYLRDYLDFDLEIREGEPRGYAVAVRSPAGEAQEEMSFPFDERQLRDKLKDLEIALLRSGGTRRALSTEERTVQEFGRSTIRSNTRRQGGHLLLQEYGPGAATRQRSAT
jgi:hypothetical protein